MAPKDSDHPSAELTATGRVILGMLASGRRTGYDIKAFVDRTTRYFWAASYGQIYPELRKRYDRVGENFRQMQFELLSRKLAAQPLQASSTAGLTLTRSLRPPSAMVSSAW